MEKVMVTGAAGFIGSHVCDALTKDGFKVVGVDDLSTGRKENISHITDLKFYQVDITDKEKIEEVFKKEQPEAVIHLAAQINVRVSIEDPVIDARINILGMLNVLECCRRFKVKKVIYSSSAAIYGDPYEVPISEEASKEPLSPYGMSKLLAEDYLVYYAENFGVEGVSLRYSNVYGPRQDPRGEAGVISVFFTGVLQEDVVKIFGDGEQTRDFVYVTDVAKANLLALKKKPREVCINIGSGKEITVNDLFRAIKEVSGSSADAEHTEAMKGEIRRSCFDIKKAEKELGWTPEVDLETGLEETYQWLKKELGLDS